MLMARLIADIDDWETRVDAARADLAAAKMPIVLVFRHEWSPRVLEFQFASADQARVNAVIDAHFGPVDRLLSAGSIELPHLFVSDMDSTMIGQECIDELADYAGIKAQIADITERAMQGELDFEAALRERVALLAGLEESAIAQCLAERITATPGSKTLVATLAALGTRTVLVTGGFHHFADPVAEMLGFHRVVGNRLAVEGGKLTGGLIGPITDSAVKAAVLREELAGLGEGGHSLATGDGANDIPMIQAATYGFAYRAKPKARAAANGRVDAEDLTTVLTLLGVPRSRWVAS